jgi:hypothetical protein
LEIHYQITQTFGLEQSKLTPVSLLEQRLSMLFKAMT